MYAPYVPSDCIANWQSSVCVPHNCRLTLVGDTNSLDVLDFMAVVQKNVGSPVDALLHRVNDLPRVMFVPSGSVSIEFHYWRKHVLTPTEDTFG
jgi:hypothetical protein